MANSNYWVHDLDPFLFQFTESFGIRYYGLAYALGFLAGMWLLHLFCKHGKAALTPEQQSFTITAMMIGVLLGGRMGYMLFYALDDTLNRPWIIFQVWKGGMASHGGFIGVTMFTPFLRRGGEASVDDYIEAIDYIINIAGEDRIGIGTDFTQGHGDRFFKWITQDKGYARTLSEFGEIKFPDGFSTIGDFPNLTAAMERAGWTETRIRNILGLNWMRLLDEVWGP